MPNQNLRFSLVQIYLETRKNQHFQNIFRGLLTKEKLKSWDKKRHLTTIDNIQTNSKIFHSFSAGFLNKYMLQEHSKKVKFRVKSDFIVLFSNSKDLIEKI